MGRRQLACASQATAEVTSTLERAELEGHEAAANEGEAQATYARAQQRAAQARELVRSQAYAREAAQQQQAALEEELEQLLAFKGTARTTVTFCADRCASTSVINRSHQLVGTSLFNCTSLSLHSVVHYSNTPRPNFKVAKHGIVHTYF